MIDELEDLIDKLTEITQRLREGFVKLVDLVKEVVASIRNAFAWLGDMVSVLFK